MTRLWLALVAGFFACGLHAQINNPTGPGPIQNPGTGTGGNSLPGLTEANNIFTVGDTVTNLSTLNLSQMNFGGHLRFSQTSYNVITLSDTATGGDATLNADAVNTTGDMQIGTPSEFGRLHLQNITLGPDAYSLATSLGPNSLIINNSSTNAVYAKLTPTSVSFPAAFTTPGCIQTDANGLLSVATCAAGGGTGGATFTPSALQFATSATASRAATATDVSSVLAVPANSGVATDGAGKLTSLPEKGVATASGVTSVAWSEDYDNGIFDCRNPKYGPGGCKGANPAQAMQDLSTAMICYGAITGKKPTTYFPPGTFKVGLPTKTTLIFPAGGNYYGAGASRKGSGTTFQGTYSNATVVSWYTGQSAVCSDGLSHTSNISAGEVRGIGEHGCAQGGCIAAPGDTNDYASGGGPSQGGMFLGDSQGNFSYLAADSNGGYGIQFDGQDSTAHHLWLNRNLQWWMAGKNASHIAVPAPAATPSTTGGTLAAGAYYYKVTATGTAIVGGAGETLPSAEITATTTGTTGSVAITWPAVTNATGYKIYKGTATGAESSYYAVTANAFTDTGAAGTSGSVPTKNTSTYNPAGDGQHGQFQSFDIDGQGEYIETYGTFDASGVEYGHTAGVLLYGGTASFSHIFTQLDEIGIYIGSGQDGMRVDHFRVDASKGSSVVNNDSNDIITNGAITSDCQDSTVMGVNNGVCVGVEGAGAKLSNIQHLQAGGIFGPEHSSGFIYGGGAIGPNVDGPFQQQNRYAANPFDTFTFVQSFAGQIGPDVTGPKPDLKLQNGIHPSDTTATNYTSSVNGMLGQGFYVKADNANVTLKGPGAGGHWHNCNGGDLNLNLGGIFLHYTVMGGLYGDPEIYEQCDGGNTSGSYLPLAGGTLTGPLTATTITATGLTVNDASGVGGGMDNTEGSAPTGVSGTDKWWADSTSHWLKMNNNNAGTQSIVGITTLGTAGDGVKLDANGKDIVDAGGPPVTAHNGVPTSVLSAGAGTGPSGSSFAAGSTDDAGWFSFTTGSTPTANAGAVTINYAGTYAAARRCMVGAGNPAAASAAFYVPSSQSTATSFVVFAGTPALTASTPYQISYRCN